MDKTIMKNPYNTQAPPIREIIEKQLSYGWCLESIKKEPDGIT